MAGQAEPRKRGRPQSLAPLSAAERMRRYRSRLLAKGIRGRTVMAPDPVLAAIRFRPDSLLTPGEQDVLRRFCYGLRRLTALPREVAIFGSRAKGGSDERSDLDVAVIVDREEQVLPVQRAVGAIAASASADYRSGEYGIFLRPVVVRKGARGARLKLTGRDVETVWTRPR